MRKNLTLLLITLATVAATYGLILYVGMHGFVFAWTLNFVLMACVFALTETLKSPLDYPYFDAKVWERRGKVYETCGINFYRKLLVWTGWEKLNKSSNPVEKDSQALSHLHYRTKQSEFGHVIILIIVFGFNIVVAWRFGLRESIWLFVLNILLNLYPILLQRYNRPRLERALAIVHKKP